MYQADDCQLQLDNKYFVEHLCWWAAKYKRWLHYRYIHEILKLLPRCEHWTSSLPVSIFVCYFSSYLAIYFTIIHTQFCYTRVIKMMYDFVIITTTQMHNCTVLKELCYYMYQLYIRTLTQIWRFTRLCHRHVM